MGTLYHCCDFSVSLQLLIYKKANHQYEMFLIITNEYFQLKAISHSSQGNKTKLCSLIRRESKRDSILMASISLHIINILQKVVKMRRIIKI
jgi:hypothetical protein